MPDDSPLRHWVDRDGALLRLRLARPRANLIDAAKIAVLHAALVSHREHGRLRGVLLNAEGPHFSFGASVEEHLPAQCARMLASLHALLGAMLEYPAPILVAVRGHAWAGGSSWHWPADRFTPRRARQPRPCLTGRLGRSRTMGLCGMPW